MLDENDVVEAVADHLRQKGYTIVQKLHTSEQGVDLIAERASDGQRLLVEAKGGTSSRQGSNRYGKPYTPSQVYDRVSKGFYAVACLQEKRNSNNTQAILACPDTTLFNKYLSRITVSASKLGIMILLVKPDRSVHELKL